MNRWRIWTKKSTEHDIDRKFSLVWFHFPWFLILSLRFPTFTSSPFPPYKFPCRNEKAKKGVSERRRKDHIAALILELGDKLPKTSEQKQLQKVGILGRAIEYIGELENKNKLAAENDGGYS